MQSSMESWFFMRPGLGTFRLEPEKHGRYLFGKEDRQRRDILLDSIEEAAFSNDGHKATVYGDYGRGKTHQCHNIIFEIKRRDLKFAPVYIKCGAYKKKEDFSSLFREFLLGHRSEILRDLAMAYQHKVNEKKATPIESVVRSEDIGHVFKEGLTVPSTDIVKLGMQWLGGDPKVGVEMFGPALKPRLTDSGDFGAVLRGLSEMFITVYDKIPLYFIDEAERIGNIGPDVDTFWNWAAALRELLEIPGVGMIFMIGAKTRDNLPSLFTLDEIVTRIGVTNYLEFLNPSRDDIKEFFLEQFQTSIKKGPVPESQREIVDPDALNDEIPEELQEITGGNPDRLESFPFEPDAFEEFVDHTMRGEMSNKPREAQILVQKTAQRAMRKGERTITTEILEELDTEGL